MIRMSRCTILFLVPPCHGNSFHLQRVYPSSHPLAPGLYQVRIPSRDLHRRSRVWMSFPLREQHRPGSLTPLHPVPHHLHSLVAHGVPMVTLAVGYFWVSRKISPWQPLASKGLIRVTIPESRGVSIHDILSRSFGVCTHSWAQQLVQMWHPKHYLSALGQLLQDTLTHSVFPTYETFSHRGFRSHVGWSILTQREASEHDFQGEPVDMLPDDFPTTQSGIPHFAL